MDLPRWSNSKVADKSLGISRCESIPRLERRHIRRGSTLARLFEWFEAGYPEPHCLPERRVFMLFQARMPPSQPWNNLSEEAPPAVVDTATFSQINSRGSRKCKRILSTSAVQLTRLLLFLADMLARVLTLLYEMCLDGSFKVERIGRTNTRLGTYL